MVVISELIEAFPTNNRDPSTRSQGDAGRISKHSLSIPIGLITVGMCLVASVLGNRLRNVLAKWAEIAGGAVLILIGARLLLQHFR